MPSAKSKLPATRRRGRPAKPPTDYREQTKDAWWKYAHDVMNGRPIKTAGPTGKPVTKILDERHQVKVWETAGRKLFGDLSATAITADVEATVHTPEVSNRDAARAIVSMLGKGGLTLVDQSEQRMIEHREMHDVTPDVMKNAEAVHSYQRQVEEIRLNKAMDGCVMAEPGSGGVHNDSAIPSAPVTGPSEARAVASGGPGISGRPDGPTTVGQDGGDQAALSLGSPPSLAPGKKVRVGDGFVQHDFRTEGKFWSLNAAGERQSAHRTYESARSHVLTLRPVPASTKAYINGADTIEDLSRRDNQPSIARTRSRAQPGRPR